DVRMSVLLSSGSFLDLIDVIGDQAMGLPVDISGCLCRWSLYEAEHLAVSLVDPVAQVAHVVGVLRMQVGEMRPGDVVHRHATVDLVNIHEQRHSGPLPQSSKLTWDDRRFGRAADSSAKVPGLAVRLPGLPQVNA